jgi:hypothetical protein
MAKICYSYGFNVILVDDAASHLTQLKKSLLSDRYSNITFIESNNNDRDKLTVNISSDSVRNHPRRSRDVNHIFRKQSLKQLSSNKRGQTTSNAYESRERHMVKIRDIQVIESDMNDETSANTVLYELQQRKIHDKVIFIAHVH